MSDSCHFWVSHGTYAWGVVCRSDIDSFMWVGLTHFVGLTNCMSCESGRYDSMSETEWVTHLTHPYDWMSQPDSHEYAVICIESHAVMRLNESNSMRAYRMAEWVNINDFMSQWVKLYACIRLYGSTRLTWMSKCHNETHWVIRTRLTWHSNITLLMMLLKIIGLFCKRAL